MIPKERRKLSSDIDTLKDHAHRFGSSVTFADISGEICALLQMFVENKRDQEISLKFKDICKSLKGAKNKTWRDSVSNYLKVDAEKHVQINCTANEMNEKIERYKKRVQRKRKHSSESCTSKANDNLSDTPSSEHSLPVVTLNGDSVDATKDRSLAERAHGLLNCYGAEADLVLKRIKNLQSPFSETREINRSNVFACLTSIEKKCEHLAKLIHRKRICGDNVIHCKMFREKIACRNCYPPLRETSDDDEDTSDEEMNLEGVPLGSDDNGDGGGEEEDGSISDEDEIADKRTRFVV